MCRWWWSCTDSPSSGPFPPSPPMGGHPDVADAVPSPVTRGIVAPARGAADIAAADPHILIAIPVPVARLPIVTAARRRDGFVTWRRYRAVRHWRWRRLRHGGAQPETEQDHSASDSDRLSHQCRLLRLRCLRNNAFRIRRQDE